MDKRLETFLLRIGEADQMLRGRGDDPQPFLLIYAGGGALVHHPAWNRSWPVPTAQDIDDLEELGFLRTEEGKNTKRIFSLTVKARPSRDTRGAPVGAGLTGRAGTLARCHRAMARGAGAQPPELFEMPARLIDAATSEGFIDVSAREAFAGRIVQLVREGYLNGNLPDFEQASDEQRLGLSSGLTLAMKAQDWVQPPPAAGPPSMNFYGSVVAGQIAAGDITNYVTFNELLDKAEEELGQLDDVEAEVREEAPTILDALRGRAVGATGAVMTGAGGSLLASITGQRAGLPPG